MKNYSVVMAALLGLALGFGLAKLSFENKKLTKEVNTSKTVAKDTVSATINAGIVGKDVDDKITLNDSQALTGVLEMQKRLDSWKPPVVITNTKVIANENCPAPDAPLYAGPDSLMPLDIGSVRVLNAIRAGTPIDRVSITSEESGTPATITVRYFINSDSEIAKMYNALAIRHNSLVSEVEKYQLAQQKRHQRN